MKTFPATIHRPGEPIRNQYDELVPGPHTDIPARCYRVRRRDVREVVDGVQVLVTRTDAALTKDTDARETDEITLEGIRYKVTGVYREQQSLPYVHVELERVS